MDAVYVGLVAILWVTIVGLALGCARLEAPQVKS
jgi:hypothetical protein